MKEFSRWELIGDMNQNSSITVSDALLWLQWFYFLPGDGLLYLFMEKLIPIGQFFELTSASYGNFFSGVISFFAWGICWLYISILA